MTQNSDQQCQSVEENPESGISLPQRPDISGVENLSRQAADSVEAGDLGTQPQGVVEGVQGIDTDDKQEVRESSHIGQVFIEPNDKSRFIIACRVTKDDGQEVSALVRKKSADSFCDVTGEWLFADKPELIPFLLSADEFDRIQRFLSQKDGVEVFYKRLDSKGVIDKCQELILRLIESSPGILPITDKNDSENLLNFEIEGVYDAATREAHTAGADAQRFENFEKLISVTPTIKLDAVSTDTLTPEGSKSKQIFELLKELISPADSEVIANGTTIARPIVLDVNGHFVCGLADGLRADQSDLYVFSFPVKEELDDDHRAFRMISEARGIVDLPKETIKACMTIMYGDLRPRTGQRAKAGQENAILNLAEHWSKFTNCSIHNSQRELTDSRDLLDLKQSKTYDSAGHEETQAIEDAVNRVISQIAAEMQLLEDKSLYLQNRFRSRLKERVSKQCRKLKSVAKKSGGRK